MEGVACAQTFFFVGSFVGSGEDDFPGFLCRGHMFSTAGILHNTEYIRFARFCLHEYNAYISYVGTPNGSPQLCGFVVVPPAISMVYNSFFSLSRWQIRIIRVPYGVHDRKVVQVQELRLSLSQPPKRVFEAVYYARFFEVQKWTPFAPSF